MPTEIEHYIASRQGYEDFLIVVFENLQTNEFWFHYVGKEDCWILDGEDFDAFVKVRIC